MIWFFTLVLSLANASNPISDAVDQIGFCKSSTVPAEISVKVKAAQILADHSQCGKVEWTAALDQKLLQHGYELTYFMPAFSLPNGDSGYHQLIQTRFEYSKAGDTTRKAYTNSCNLSYSAKVYLQKHPQTPCALDVYWAF